MNITEPNQNPGPIEPNAHTLRAAHILLKYGYTSRSKIRKQLDDVMGIRGIGPTLRKVINNHLATPREVWEARFPGIEGD